MLQAMDPTNVMTGPLAVSAAEYWHAAAHFRLALALGADIAAHAALDRLLTTHAADVWPAPVSERFIRRLPAMWAELKQLDNQVVSR